MDRNELIEKLKFIEDEYPGDEEAMHMRADEALLEYINDIEVTEKFKKIPKWYA